MGQMGLGIEKWLFCQGTRSFEREKWVCCALLRFVKPFSGHSVMDRQVGQRSIIPYRTSVRQEGIWELFAQ
jgi:hypothetical protein